MAPESTSKGKSKTVAIIGAGPAGCICAKFLQDKFEVTLFDMGKFLRTILPTGGGRCNLAHAEYDFRELASNYPRGEKFLYSVFSKFATSDTIDFFEKLGIKTYTQDDNRIFPISNSSSEVREKMLKSLSKSNLIKEQVNNIQKLQNCWKIVTDKSSYAFDYVVIAIGGHSSFKLIENLGVNINEPTQALVGLITKEDFSEIAGVSINNILFTHKGVSGPLIYKLSSINARKNFPYNITLELTPEFNLQEYLDKKPHKEIKNLLGQFIPKALATWEDNELNQEIATAILTEAGFTVEIAANGQIAVDMLRDAQPGYYNLILMDVQMPIMDGYAATQAIRALDDPKLASIPILAMTANAFEEDRQAALRAGMNGHIAKPIDIDTLFETLDEIIN